MVGWDGVAKRFDDRQAAQRAVDYLNGPRWDPDNQRPLWDGDWEVVERTTPD